MASEPDIPAAAHGLPLPLRATDILERVADAFLVLDREWRIVYANGEACRINQKPLQEFVGRVHWEEWPAAVGTALESQLRRAMSEGVDVHFEHRYAAGPYDVWLEVDAYPTADGLNLFYRDVTGRRRAEEALRASERRFREMADAMPHIAWTTDPGGAVDYYNQRWYDYSGLTFAQTRDWGWASVIHPDDLEHAGGVWQAALQAGLVSEVEYRLRRADGAYRLHLARSEPVREAGEIVRWVGTATDIEDRRRAEEALRRSQEDLRLAVDGAQVGTFYCDWPLDKIVWNDTCKRHFFLPPDAEVDFALFYSLLHPDDRGPTRQSIERAMAERVEYDVEYRTLGPDGRTRWVNAVGRFYYGPDGTPIRFDGITLDVSARKAAEEALRESEERYRLLLDSTGEGIYGIDLAGRFTFVNHAAARTLGFAPEQLIGRSGHTLIHHTRPDGEAYPEGECPIYRTIRSGESAHVEDDVFWRADGTPFPVSYGAAPIRGHGALRGAVVTFSDISERRALEMERERLAERERNIAAQLQAALTPAVPERVPGLALTKHYEAALAEAMVGGDFYDVFPMEKGRTALVVGDLSGKGLAAATQVATVRNMLRYALYRSRTVAGALQSLNALLAEQGLLAGFATLFVGAYDSGAGALTYVNCGQEPALVRRAGTGWVEELRPTGPVLGAFEGAAFAERTVALSPGDALAVFTDGLTEVGASRTALFGVEGVATLLAEPVSGGDAGPTAEALARRLIAGVDGFAQAGSRDDVCLLVAVVDGG